MQTKTETKNSEKPIGAYLADKQVATRYGVSRQTPWGWYKKKSTGFPAPVSLSPGCTRWRLSDLEAWETAQAMQGAA